MQTLSDLSSSHSHKKRLFVILTLFIVGLAIFLYIYAGVRGHDTVAHLDAPVLHWMTSHRRPVVTAVMKAITTITNPIYVAIVILIGSALWAWYRKEVWRPALLVGAMAVVLVLGTLIKHVTHRHRPPIASMIPPLEIDYSFPSGHTFGIAVCLLVFGYLLYSRAPRKRSFIIWISITVVSVGLVAASRLYLGYHWITDVSASVGLALMVLAIVIAIDTYKPARRLVKKPTKVL